MRLLRRVLGCRSRSRRPDRVRRGEVPGRHRLRVRRPRRLVHRCPGPADDHQHRRLPPHRTTTTPTGGRSSSTTSKLLDVSCGGATAAAVIQSQDSQGDGRVRPPQIEVVSADDRPVTVGLGVNDMDFSVPRRLRVPAARRAATRVALRATDANAKGPAPSSTRIQQRTSTLSQAIAERAPDARIIAVGYPRLLADSGACPKRLPFAQTATSTSSATPTTSSTRPSRRPPPAPPVSSTSTWRPRAPTRHLRRGAVDQRLQGGPVDRSGGVPPDACGAGRGGGPDPRPALTPSSPRVGI